MISHFMPNRAAAAAVWRTWLDCTAPWVTRVSASLASASPSRYSSLRVLLPPPARPVQSSRLIHSAGPPPPGRARCSVSPGRGSNGVGRWAKRTGLKRAKCMAPPAICFPLRLQLPRQGGGLFRRQLDDRDDVAQAAARGQGEVVGRADPVPAEVPEAELFRGDGAAQAA